MESWVAVFEVYRGEERLGWVFDNTMLTNHVPRIGETVVLHFEHRLSDYIAAGPMDAAEVIGIQHITGPKSLDSSTYVKVRVQQREAAAGGQPVSKLDDFQWEKGYDA